MSKLYEALAEAFLTEGVDTQFVLMGDGNMHWSTAFARLPGVQTIHVRHEHCAVAAATAYNIATGKIAAASVTCGPGLTQLMTALPAAVRAHLPMVVFAGEAPVNAKFYNQYIEQAPLVTATGAHYIAAHSVPRMMEHVREAFHIAKYGRRPVVLGIPYDLQKVEYTPNQPYETSAMYYPKVGRIHPDPAIVAEAVERLKAAKRPMPPGLERHYQKCRQRYWDARTRYGNMLSREDPELWRMLMPCDPVITVADDVVFFECFSADESSYGCLTVDRETAFGKSAGCPISGRTGCAADRPL